MEENQHDRRNKRSNRRKKLKILLISLYQKIEKYHKKADSATLAESWELSFHPDGPTLTEDGTPLAEVFGKEQWGTAAQKFESFPQLIKLIDAEKDLSVQVHPSDEYALRYENSYGKTEMWYIVSAEDGAGIYLGFRRDVTAAEFEQAIAENTLTNLLNFYPVRAGECYFIPAGIIHAIGKGCLICEVQQNSNLTYRVYDYGRLGADGNPRELHVEKAKAVTELKKFEYRPLSEKTEEGEVIADCRYFTVKKISLQGEKTLSCNERSFKYLICLDGEATLEGTPLPLGASFLVPAEEGVLHLVGNATLLTSELL